MRLLNRLNLIQKLILICVTFLLPTSVLLYRSVIQINDSLQFTEFELAGNQLLKPLNFMLKNVSEHRELKIRQLQGAKGLETQLQGIVAELEEELNQFESAYMNFESVMADSSRMQSQERKENNAFQNLVKAINELRLDETGAVADVSQKHLKIMGQILALIEQVGDTSKLVLDPDLDSYYAIISAGVLLPESQVRADRLMNLVDLSGKDQSPEQAIEIRQQIAAADAILREKISKNIIANIRKSIAEDEASYGTSPILQNEVSKSLKNYTGAFTRLFDSMRELIGSDIKTKWNKEALTETLQKSRQANTDLTQQLHAAIAEILNSRLQAQFLSRRMTIALTIGTMLFAICFVFVVAKSITKPMETCVESLQQLVEQDMGLAEIIQQLSSNAEETSTQGAVVSAAAEQVSKSVKMVAVATQEMDSSIREVAKQASTAAKVATNGVKVATDTNQTVVKLTHSSQEIGKVVKVITSIAEQTNLLALNATIEAARLGDAGKGFAVVATEVKELARETAKATEEISVQIDAIQTDSKNAVEAINEISVIINRINDIQSAIASGVEEQTVTTREIGRSVQEAASGTSEIARNIVEVAAAAKNTSQGILTIKEAAAQLSRMSGYLKDLVSRFHFG